MDQGRHAIIHIRTIDGRQLENEVWFTPMTRDELATKFDYLVQPILGEKTTRVKTACEQLAGAPSVRPLMEMLQTN